MMPVRFTQSWLPTIFNDLLDNDWVEKSNSTAPAINVYEDKVGYTVEIAAPGMTKDDFKVNIDADGNLVVSMEKKTSDDEKDKKTGRYLRREFSYAKFEQCMILPDDVDKNKIAAKVENGILNVSMPKITEAEIKKSQRNINID
jgi:HSP20 family protein